MELCYCDAPKLVEAFPCVARNLSTEAVTDDVETLGPHTCRVVQGFDEVRQFRSDHPGVGGRPGVRGPAAVTPVHDDHVVVAVLQELVLHDSNPLADIQRIHEAVDDDLAL